MKEKRDWLFYLLMGIFGLALIAMSGLLAMHHDDVWRETVGELRQIGAMLQPERTYLETDVYPAATAHGQEQQYHYVVRYLEDGIVRDIYCRTDIARQNAEAWARGNKHE